MLLNLDKVVLSSTTSSLRNFSSGTFTITVSGNIGAGATGTYSGSTAFNRANSQVRLYVQQNTVPVTGPDYSSSELLPFPPYGSFGFEPLIYVGCTVVGSPAVSSIDTAFSVLSTTSSLGVTVSIFNPYGGTMTLTPTIFTFRYVAFLPT